MNQITNLSEFGSPIERVERAIACFRDGKGVIVVDDEDRENEGDLIFPAETITVEQMAMLIREGSGIVCLPLTEERLTALALPQMVGDNTSSMGTAFTVSIEAKVGVTTGVSAADRVKTVQTAIADDAKPQDLARPGHMFPLRANPGGVLARAGHTEASVELARLGGRKPAAVLCELTNPDGTMSRLPELIEFAHRHDFHIVAIADLVAYLRQSETAAA